MKRVFILKGLDCPNCSAKIEKEVGALPGVESSVVNLMQQTLTVQSEKSADATLAEQVETIVHSHEPDVEVSEKTEPAVTKVYLLKGSGLSELDSAKSRERVGELGGVASYDRESDEPDIDCSGRNIGGYLPAGHRYHDRPQPRARC